MTQQTSSTNQSQNTTQQQNQQQQSFTNPWVRSLGPLNNLLQSMQVATGNTGVTPAQTSALNGLMTGANGLPNFGGASAGVTSGLLQGDPTGLLTSGNNNFQAALQPIIAAGLDPTKNPNLANALQAVQYNATNANQAQFSGAGRTGGGAQAYALGQGITNAEAPLLLGQYNQDVANTINAGSQMFGANNATSNAITGNQQSGLSAAQNQPNIALAPQLAQLQTAQTQYNLPLSNVAGAEGLTLPIAGMGGSSSGTASGSGTGTMVGQSNTTSTPSILQDMSMLGGILGGNMGFFGSSGLGGTTPTGNILRGIGL
jgi:hypothetical protein